MKEAVQVVLLNDQNQVLAVSRKTDHKDFGLPGGKRDPEDASPEAAIIREVKEETGLDISNLRLIFAMHRNGSMGYTYLADYSGKISTNEPHVVKWVNYEVVNKGSFGRWNKMVLESLRDMKVKVRVYPIPKQDWLFVVFPNEHSGNNELQVSICPRKFYDKNGHLPDRFSDREHEEMYNLLGNGDLELLESEENIYAPYSNKTELITREEIDAAMIEAGFIKDKKFYDEFSGVIQDGEENFTGRIIEVGDNGIIVQIHELEEQRLFRDKEPFKNIDTKKEIKIKMIAKNGKVTLNISSDGSN